MLSKAFGMNPPTHRPRQCAVRDTIFFFKSWDHPLPSLAAFPSPLHCANIPTSKVARARGAHFARPERKASSGAPARGTSGANGRGRGRAAAGAGAGSGSGGGRAGEDGPKELWPGPFAEARRVSERTGRYCCVGENDDMISQRM